MDTTRFPFTERRLRDLAAPATGRVLYHDATSPLKLEATAAGSRTYYLVLRVNGKPRRVRLGAFPDVRLEDARKLALDRMAEIGRGADPTAERRVARAAAKAAAYTFGDAADDYLEDGKAKGRKAGTDAEYRRLLDRHLSDWRSRPLGEIDKATLRDRHRDVGKRSGEATANALMRVARAVFNYAKAVDRIAVNPADALRGRWYESKERHGRIPDDKLRAFLDALDAVRTSPDAPESHGVAADWIALLLLTGLRRNEGASLRWEQVDAAAGALSVLGKNKVTLTLPVTPAVAAILDRREAGRGRSPWVFPARGEKGNGGGHVVEPRKVLALVAEATGVDVTLHDLRRTFVSVAAVLVPGPVLKSLVNHKAAKTGDVTQRHYVRLTPAQLRPHLEAVQRELLRGVAATPEAEAFPRIAAAG